MKKKLWLTTLLILLAASSLWAQRNLNFTSLKRDTQVFERILDERIRQVFTGPYALTSEPHAAYLQGYGVLVSFQLNINRARIRTPFGEVEVPQTYPGAVSESDSNSDGLDHRQRQLNRVREILIECLADYSRAIKQLAAHDRVSISAHIEDRNELNPDRRSIVLVISAQRDDVDLLALDKISLQDFQQRLHIIEY